MFETLLCNNHNKLIVEQPPVIEEEPVDTVRYGKVLGQSGDYFGLNMDMDKTGNDLAVFSARNDGSIHYLKRQNKNYVEKQVLTIGGMITSLSSLFRTHREPVTISPDGNVIVALKNNANPASIVVYKKNQQGLWDFSQEIPGMKSKDMTSCDTSEDGTWLFVSSLTSKVFVFKMGADGKYAPYQELSRLGTTRKVNCSDNGNIVISTNGVGGDGNTSSSLQVFMKDQNGVFVHTQDLKAEMTGISRSAFLHLGIEISGDGSTIVTGDCESKGGSAAYVFKLNPQTNQYYLFKTIKKHGSTTGFGVSFKTSYSGNTIIAGDPDTLPGTPSKIYSKTYVYKLINGDYVLTNTVTSDDSTGNDEHGMCVRVSRDSRLCVTVAPTEKVNGAIHGSIYSFGI